MGHLEILWQGIADEPAHLATAELLDVAALERASTTVESGKKSGQTDKKSGSSRPKVGFGNGPFQPEKHGKSRQEVGKSAISEKH